MTPPAEEHRVEPRRRCVSLCAWCSCGSLLAGLVTGWFARPLAGSGLVAEFERATREQQYGLVPDTARGLWGYRSVVSGEFVIEPRYLGARPFADGLARVMQAPGRFAYLDPQGKIVIELSDVVGAGDFSEGRAPIGTERGWGYIGRDGEVVIEPMFRKPSAFFGGVAKVTRVTPLGEVLDGTGIDIGFEEVLIDYRGNVVAR